jgi:RNA polymerase sigma-70 factor (ECF subfamily)
MARRILDISALYAAHGEKLLLFLVRRTTDTEVALDLWAETFAQALAARHRFRGSSDDEAAGWLYAIARAQLSRYYRRGRAERRALDRLRLQRPPADELVEAELARRAGLHELRHELAAAIAELSDDTRQAIELRVIAELPYPAVAQRLAISEQAARARVSRGLRALGDLLDLDLITEATRP